MLPPPQSSTNLPVKVAPALLVHEALQATEVQTWATVPNLRVLPLRMPASHRISRTNTALPTVHCTALAACQECSSCAGNAKAQT